MDKETSLILCIWFVVCVIGVVFIAVTGTSGTFEPEHITVTNPTGGIP